MNHGSSLPPWKAFPAMAALIRDPNDTAQVFTIIQALSFGTLRRMTRRYRRTDSGRAILRERRSLLPALERAALQRLPAGSLGRAYLEFIDAEGITPAGLVEASERGYEPELLDDEAMEIIADRMRDQHDLWHVVTGYKGDLIGEAALLAFTFAQTRNPGVALIASIGWLKTGPLPGSRRLIEEAFRRGRRADWLPAQDWESLLALPIDEVRARLKVDAPPRYQPVYARDVDFATMGPFKPRPAA